MGQALTTHDCYCGLWIEGREALDEGGQRTCEFVAFVEFHHRIDSIGARSFELKSGSYRWVVGVDDGVEVLAARYDDYPLCGGGRPRWCTLGARTGSASDACRSVRGGDPGRGSCGCRSACGSARSDGARWARGGFRLREGHGCHGQHAQHRHHCSHHTKNRHITAHANPPPLSGWALRVSLVDNIVIKGLLPVPWLTLARSSVTPGIPSRICRMAIFGKHRENLWQDTFVNTFERASHPYNDHGRTALPENPHLN